ncbi:DUF4259 domain-containing protein [Saccharothrix violaceirubra]|uniref:Uncharacterized protein n=1 Tax=Saccharothrix violaceirubra TaxID=413306 RepID=A0A7W7WW75_9PSEU|nr:DUF4259 domain-containing protein [Saccharothrix violaceirubra]MBB4965687.1 hypothetical protein [Saccharothrix violaceirubra]
MGAFDNDFALDFLDDVRGSAPGNIPDVLSNALSAAAEVGAEDCLDRAEGEAAVAAATLVVARALPDGTLVPGGGILNVMPMPSASLSRLAVVALRRVLDENSEVCQLWREVDLGEQWRSGVEALLAKAVRISGFDEG